MRTASIFPDFVRISETILNAMPFIENKIGDIQKEKDNPFSPSEVFVLSYFRRNKIYLQSAYILGVMGFYGPSLNLQRTVYETILRGYLFIVNPDEANNYHDNLSLEKERTFLKSRSYYKHSYLCKELFTEDTKRKQREFYKLLCNSAHTEIKGLLQDFPKYNMENIVDSLRILLMLSYGNIQMVSEMFLNSLSIFLRNAISKLLEEIATLIKNVPLFEPDREIYAPKIKLKKGNFQEVMR
jgi:hypothetical protein